MNSHGLGMRFFLPKGASTSYPKLCAGPDTEVSCQLPRASNVRFLPRPARQFNSTIAEINPGLTSTAHALPPPANLAEIGIIRAQESLKAKVICEQIAPARV